MIIYVAGNCQAAVLADLLRIATGLPVELLSEKKTLEPERIIFAQLSCSRWLDEQDVHWFPRMGMAGFHPDIVHGREYEGVWSPLRGYSSSIVLKAWCESIPAHGALTLFNANVYERLGLFQYFEAAKAELMEEGRDTGFPMAEFFPRWLERGCFMHTANHPKGFVMVDVAHTLLARAKLDWKPLENEFDRQDRGCGWPVYPEIAERIGVEGNFAFRTHTLDGGRIIDLKEFVAESYEMYAGQNLPRAVSFKRLASPRYENLRSQLPVQLRGRHPYLSLSDHQYWRKAMRDDVDPVTNAFPITKNMRVATAGSCFAQHISAALAANGFNYFVAETDPGDGGSNYGVFSARYGNIYTARQLLQLIQRAYGRWSPKVRTWPHGKGFVDPFRPEIEPGGFETRAAVLEARKSHFEAVRRMFNELDVFVFTLGLTEAWRATVDGAVLPLAPGVSGGRFNAEQYEFVNFGVSDVVQDLKKFLALLSRVNARARVILTVSPVPLIATYEPRHVLVSTTYSKSVLRVAADEVARSMPNVTYFPSYELITGSFNRGRYFERDLRAVTPEGVAHVMRVFFRHFSPDASIAEFVHESMEVVCDEESLVRQSPRPQSPRPQSPRPKSPRPQSPRPQPGKPQSQQARPRRAAAAPVSAKARGATALRGGLTGTLASAWKRLIRATAGKAPHPKARRAPEDISPPE
jgi:hypothetical protein